MYFRLVQQEKTLDSENAQIRKAAWDRHVVKKTQTRRRLIKMILRCEDTVIFKTLIDWDTWVTEMEGRITEGRLKQQEKQVHSRVHITIHLL